MKFESGMKITTGNNTILISKIAKNTIINIIKDHSIT